MHGKVTRRASPRRHPTLALPWHPMRTSVRWLNDYLDRPVTPDEAALALTRVGFPVAHRESTDDGDVVLEVELTSNRGDCLSHLNLARELAAMTGRTVKEPTFARIPDGAGPVPVTNHDHESCPLYTARVIRGVSVRPSPAWMQQRLRAIGQTPRNNLVDATNYVLFEYGQPTHIFDLARLAGPAIHVRPAKDGESILPIGEGAKPLSLRAGDLVIADATVPAAIAGVKGGAPSAVSDRTTDVLIEAATFAPKSVRSSSRGLRVASDSSYRFERGVAPADVDAAADRLVALILEHAGGRLDGGRVAAGPSLPSPRLVQVRVERAQRVLGYPLPADEMLATLRTLGFAPSRTGDTITCTVPPRRIDIEREIDLIEELARLHGMDRVPMLDAIQVRVAATQPQIEGMREARRTLVGLGFVETVTHTLVSERAAQPFTHAGTTPLRVSDERAGDPILRPSLLSSLMATARLNADRGTPSIRLMEAANVFDLQGPELRERSSLGLLITDTPDADEAMRTMRGCVERLLRAVLGAHAAIEVVPLAGAAGLSPAALVRTRGHAVGTIGLLSVDALKAFGLDAPIAGAELFIKPLLTQWPPDTTVRALPSFPSIDRDVSAIVADGVAWASIEGVVRDLSLEHFESIAFVGTYRGKQVGQGRKSVTMRLTFRSSAGTLRREDADPQVARVIGALHAGVGAEVRS